MKIDEKTIKRCLLEPEIHMLARVVYTERRVNETHE